MNNQNFLTNALVCTVTIATLSAAACSGGPKDFVTGEPKIDTTLTDPRDSYIPPTATATTIPTRVTAGGYPIQYFISVPAGWPGKRAWPIVVTVTGSGRDYEANAQKFAQARDAAGDPFIIVTPVTLTNSGDGPVSRDNPAFQYPSSTWDLIDQQGRCTFDQAGVKAIIEEVRNKYSGQTKAFLTAWSGGGHLGWASVLLHPELLRAGALVGSNYSGRCVTKEASPLPSISTAPERVLLPVRSFNGADDPNLQLGINQQAVALQLAIANGFTNTSTEVVSGYAHDPMPVKILSYFRSLLASTER